MLERNPNGRLFVVKRIKVGKTIKWERTLHNGEIMVFRTKKAAMNYNDLSDIFGSWIAEGPWRHC